MNPSTPTVLESKKGGYDPDFYEDLYAAEDKHFWFRARNRIVGAAAAELTRDLPSPYHVLEFGCGDGNVTRVLQTACSGGHVVGVDLFLEGLRYARRRGIGLLVQADIRQSPFVCHFDLVGMFDVLEHIPDDVGTLRTLYDITKPGGYLMITVPAHQALWSYFDEASCHCRRYELEELRAKCVGVGFEVEYGTEFMASIYPLLRAQRRWAGKRQHATGATPVELAKREL